MKPLHMTHDLSCTLGDLSVAAGQYPRDMPYPTTTEVSRSLFVAAIAFTIQLAIDECGRDPDQMRALERELIARLEFP